MSNKCVDQQPLTVCGELNHAGKWLWLNKLTARELVGMQPYCCSMAIRQHPKRSTIAMPTPVARLRSHLNVFKILLLHLREPAYLGLQRSTNHFLNWWHKRCQHTRLLLAGRSDPPPTNQGDRNWPLSQPVPPDSPFSVPRDTGCNVVMRNVRLPWLYQLRWRRCQKAWCKPPQPKQ